MGNMVTAPGDFNTLHHFQEIPAQIELFGHSSVAVQVCARSVTSAACFLAVAGEPLLGVLFS